eukprot:362900-Rhodomonas_salina.1
MHLSPSTGTNAGVATCIGSRAAERAGRAGEHAGLLTIANPSTLRFLACNFPPETDPVAGDAVLLFPSVTSDGVNAATPLRRKSEKTSTGSTERSIAGSEQELEVYTAESNTNLL